MSATERLRAEQDFHDEQAARRQRHFTRHAASLLIDEDRYLNHETWIRPAVALLGELGGLRVLDYGCGHGMASVLFAHRGARVTAFDLSPWYLEEAATRARHNDCGEQIQFVQASAEALPFADRSFDRIWGNAILHHLDVSTAAAEVARVLKPDGLAVFCEPWGGNRLLEWARRRLPYPLKQRSADEHPLRESDLDALRAHFGEVRVQPFQLLSMVRRIWPSLPLLSTLEHIDESLIRLWPRLRSWCRYVVLSLRAPRRL